SARNRLTPTAKFGAATTPMPCRATASRISCSRDCHPVVPITSGVPRGASFSTVTGTASAAEKSIATSASGHAAPALPRAIAPVTSNPYSGASVSTSCPIRSEEHTSELQSLAYLVCRLLLEKKKQKQQDHKEVLKT